MYAVLRTCHRSVLFTIVLYVFCLHLYQTALSDEGDAILAGSPIPPVAARIEGEDLSEVAQNVMNSVVNISSVRIIHRTEKDPFLERFFGPEYQKQIPRDIREQDLGSGIIISPDGLILTNSHVVQDSDELKVTLYNQQVFDAEIIGTDPATEIAVIRIAGTISGLQPITFGNSDSLMLADFVLAIGNPFGLGHSVTMGIVSAKGRNASITDFDNFIQTDAAINPGNSGGALVNLKGELVGINTAFASETGGSEGVGFAIPSNLAYTIVQRLLRDGKVVRGWLGIGVQNLTADMVPLLDLKSSEGVLVTDIDQNSPGEHAGIQAGDVIVRVNDIKLTNIREFQDTIAMLGSNIPVTIALVRNGIERLSNATLGVREEKKTAVKKITTEGTMSVSLIDNKIRSQMKIPQTVNGVVIDELDATCPAARAGLVNGDIIRWVNRKPIESISDFNTLYTNARGSLLLYVYHHDKSVFIVVKK